MKQNDWAGRLENHLKSYRKDPKRDLWEDIEASLDRQAQQKTHVITIRRYMVAAILIGILFGGAYLFWPQHEVTMEPKLVADSEKPNEPITSLEDKKVETELTETGLMGTIISVKSKAENKGTATMRTEAPKEPAPTTESQEYQEPLATPDSKAPDPIVPSHQSQPLDHQHDHSTHTPHHLHMSLYASAGSGNYNNSNGVRMSPPLLQQFAGTRGSDAWLVGYEERQHHDQPISFGLTISYPISNRLSLSTGVVYTKLNSDFLTLMPNTQIHRHQTLHYIGVPLSLQFKFWQWKGLRVYLSAGGQADWNVKAEANTDGVDQSMSKDLLQWSVGGSLGLQYNIVPQIGLYIEPGVRHYINNGSDVSNFFKDKPTSFNLQVGLRVNLHQ